MRTTASGRSLIAAVAAAAALGLLVPAAALAANGFITGTVTKEDNAAAVANFEVDVYDAGGTQVATTCTAANGTYSSGGLAPGSYYVNFSGKGACGAPSSFAPEWYNSHFSRALADPVTVTGGNSTPNIDASLQQGAQVSGTVTDAGTANPIAHVTVDILDIANNPVKTACTGSDGKYTAAPIAPGVYSVRFTASGSCGVAGDYSTQWYNGASAPEAATAVGLSEALSVGSVDAHLHHPTPANLTVSRAGSGSGTVTSDTGGISCPGTCSASFGAGSVVTLTATASAGSTFAGWSGGGCSGTAGCTVTMNAEQSVTATFTAAGGTQPPPGSGPGPGGSAAAAPKCQLSAKPKRGRKGAPTRQLSLTFTCDQSANLTLAGTITEQLARHRTKTFRLRTVHANATAGRSGTVTVSLPRGAVSGLRKHRREAAALSLVAANPNGQGRATARITRL